MNSQGSGKPPLVDTHAHLTSSDFDSDRRDVIHRAREAGLVGIVTVGFEPGDWGAALELAGDHPDVYAALGIHPNSANQTTEASLAQLGALIKSSGERVVALGETGLDYYRQHVSHEEQRASFRAQLDLARELDLPVIVHNRDAHADALEILRRDGGGTRGVMHSFSGDLHFAQACIELGYLISLAGPVTFRKATDKHEVAMRIPLEHLLVETDCPYLTPEPFRGRRNEPAYVTYTAQAIADLRGVPFEEIARQTTANAYRLFNIKAQPAEQLVGSRQPTASGRSPAQQTTL